MTDTKALLGHVESGIGLCMRCGGYTDERGEPCAVRLAKALDAAEAEVARMRPVVEAARVVHAYAPFDPNISWPGGYILALNKLGDAVDEYERGRNEAHSLLRHLPVDE